MTNVKVKINVENKLRVSGFESGDYLIIKDLNDKTTETRLITRDGHGGYNAIDPQGRIAYQSKSIQSIISFYSSGHGFELIGKAKDVTITVGEIAYY